MVANNNSAISCLKNLFQVFRNLNMTLKLSYLPHLRLPSIRLSEIYNKNLKINLTQIQSKHVWFKIEHLRLLSSKVVNNGFNLWATILFWMHLELNLSRNQLSNIQFFLEIETKVKDWVNFWYTGNGILVIVPDAVKRRMTLTVANHYSAFARLKKRFPNIFKFKNNLKVIFLIKDCLQFHYNNSLQVLSPRVLIIS